MDRLTIGWSEGSGYLMTYEQQKDLMRELDFETYWKWEGRDLRALVLRLEMHVKRFR